MNLRTKASLLVALTLCVGAISGEENLVRKKRISGSYALYTGRHPSIVGLEYYSRYICSGTILKANIILTAAHCVVGKWYALLRVQLNVDTGLTRKSDAGIQVSNIAYHEKFHSVDYVNDVALVKLATPIELSHKLRTVSLGSSSESGDHGLMSFAMIAVEINAKTVDKVDVDHPKRISTSSCAQKYNVTTDSLDKQWCIELPESKPWVYRYTGGPIMKGDHQVGLVSTSWACGAKVPEVITDVSLLKPWIEEKAGNLTAATAKYTEIHPLSDGELQYYRSYPGIRVRREWVPWLVAIVDKYGGTLSCVGTIISRVNVLTTATCAENYPNKKIRVGSFDKDGFGSIPFDIVSAEQHPDYHGNSETSPNLAVLTIAGQFTFNNQTNKATFADEKQEYVPDSYGNVYGFVPGKGPESFEVSTLSREECGYLLFHNASKFQNQICTRRRTGLCIDGRDGSTNSGAPLFIGSQFAGIFSWTTEECADYRKPQIHTDITSHLPWILSVSSHSADPDSIYTIDQTNEINDANTYKNHEKGDGGLK